MNPKEIPITELYPRPGRKEIEITCPMCGNEHAHAVTWRDHDGAGYYLALDCVCGHSELAHECPDY